MRSAPRGLPPCMSIMRGCFACNPTDRGKLGSKRHILVDAGGIPLAVLLSAANGPFLAKSTLSRSILTVSVAKGFRDSQHLGQGYAGTGGRHR